MATNKQIAENVLKAVGGKENVVNLAHCFTRLRFTLKDESKVDQDALRKTQGVIQLIMAGGQCQVVVGSKVDALYDLICETYGISTAVEENDVADGQKHNPINTLMNTMSGVLAPTLGILTAAGIIKGVISLFASLGWVSTTSGVYMLLYAVGDGFFYFLPILLGFSAARRFKCSEYLGGHGEHRLHDGSGWYDPGRYAVCHGLLQYPVWYSHHHAGQRLHFQHHPNHAGRLCGC